MSRTNRNIPLPPPARLTLAELVKQGQVFSIRPEGTDMLLHFSVGRLVAAIADHRLPVTEAYLLAHDAQTCLNKQGVEIAHVHRKMMDNDWIQAPLIYCMWPDGSAILADGHHRYVARVMRGLPTFFAYAVPQAIWERCLVAHPRLDKVV